MKLRGGSARDCAPDWQSWLEYSGCIGAPYTGPGIYIDDDAGIESAQGKCV